MKGKKIRHQIKLILIFHTSVYGMPSQNGCRQWAAALWWCLISASRSREMGSLRARHCCMSLYPAGTGPVLVDQLWASGSCSRMIPFSHAMRLHICGVCSNHSATLFRACIRFTSFSCAELTSMPSLHAHSYAHTCKHTHACPRARRVEYKVQLQYFYTRYRRGSLLGCNN